MVVLNGRSVLSSPQPGRPVNCRTLSICETHTASVVIIVGCGGGNCKTATEICQAQATDLQYTRDIVDQSGNPVDVSSAVVSFTVFASVTGATLLTKTTADASMARPSATRVQWDIDGTESLALSAGSLYYEFWIVTSTGERYLAAYGPFKVQDTRKFDA